MTHDEKLLRRFYRTVRVATHAALAAYELGQRGASASAPVSFRALAAKSADGFRFPEAGIGGADGLIVARIERGAAGEPVSLSLQAQGAVGLSVYADRDAVVSFGPLAPDASIRFDADGRATVDLAALAVGEEDLASFDLALADPS